MVSRKKLRQQEFFLCTGALGKVIAFLGDVQSKKLKGRFPDSQGWGIQVHFSLYLCPYVILPCILLPMLLHMLSPDSSICAFLPLLALYRFMPFPKPG